MTTSIWFANHLLFVAALPPLDHAAVRRVCDAERSACFDAALIHPRDDTTGIVAQGPSGEAYTNNWGEHLYLSPLFRYALNGTCYHADGTRKTVVDVGANIGLYGLYFAIRGCVVHAVEPLPINGDHIELSIRINGLQDRFFLHRFAISTSDGGSVLMRTSKNGADTGTAHVVRDTATVEKANGYFRNEHADKWQEERVALARLDSLLLRVGRIEWLKIDVEGMELPSLCSARTLLTPDRVQHIGLEINWDTTADTEVHAIRHIMKQNGYRRAAVPGLDRNATRGSHYAVPFLEKGGTPGGLYYPWRGYFSGRHKIYMATFSLDDGSNNGKKWYPDIPPIRSPSKINWRGGNGKAERDGDGCATRDDGKIPGGKGRMRVHS